MFQNEFAISSLKDLKKVLILCGPSGSGKTCLERKLIEMSDKEIKFNKVKQVTTRPCRGENDKDNYHFITTEDYYKIESKLIGKTKVNDNLYGSIPNFINYYFSSYNSKTINTMILNVDGILDYYKYLRTHPMNVQTMLIMIDNPNPVLRKGRSMKFVEKERAELTNLINLKLVDYYLLNDSKHEIWTTPEDILEVMQIESFI
jgi:guanylate kinase